MKFKLSKKQKERFKKIWKETKAVASETRKGIVKFARPAERGFGTSARMVQESFEIRQMRTRPEAFMPMQPQVIKPRRNPFENI